MLTPAQAHAILLSVPVVEEGQCTGCTEYRVRKKLFATLWAGVGFANLRVGPDEQIMLSKEQKACCSFPTNGPKKGWIRVSLPAANEELFREVALKAWSHSAPPRLVLQY